MYTDAGPPDDPDQLVEEQDQPERGQNLVEMIALVEALQCDALDDDAEHQRRRHGDQSGQHERIGRIEHRCGEVRAHHVQRAVREIHEIHDPEHQRQACRQQEEQDAELKPVERLRDEEAEGHGPKSSHDPLSLTPPNSCPSGIPRVL
jgi:hypothetical protein